eukprot:scaffold174504_cov63-Attheya_sp.AAC.7
MAHQQVDHLRASHSSKAESSSSVLILRKDPVLNVQECEAEKNVDDDFCDSIELDLLDQIIFIEDDGEDEEISELLNRRKQIP